MNLFDDNADEDEYEAAEASSPKPEEQAEITPATNMRFIGYDDVEQKILSAINNGRMPHAIVLAGEAGRGKETFAYRLARALLSTRKAWPATDLGVASDDPVISKLVAGSHPDCTFVRRRNKKSKDELSNEIVIDTVREAIAFMALKPVESSWRVVIVDEAHLMNEEAQNAFLKTLEEPPPHTVLILIAHQLSRLLPTIRSRAQVIPFNALNPSLLLEQGGAALRALPVVTQDVVLRLARGGIGALKRLLSPGIVEGIDKMQGLLHARGEGVYGFSESWGNAKLEGGMDPMLLLEDVLADHVQTKLRMGLDDDANKDACLDAMDELRHLFHMARTRYLDKRQVIRRAFSFIH